MVNWKLSEEMFESIITHDFTSDSLMTVCIVRGSMYCMSLTCSFVFEHASPANCWYLFLK